MLSHHRASLEVFLMLWGGGGWVGLRFLSLSFKSAP